MLFVTVKQLSVCDLPLHIVVQKSSFYVVNSNFHLSVWEGLAQLNI